MKNSNRVPQVESAVAEDLGIDNPCSRNPKPTSPVDEISGQRSTPAWCIVIDP